MWARTSQTSRASHNEVKTAVERRISATTNHEPCAPHHAEQHINPSSPRDVAQSSLLPFPQVVCALRPCLKSTFTFISARNAWELSTLSSPSASSKCLPAFQRLRSTQTPWLGCDLNVRGEDICTRVTSFWSLHHHAARRCFLLRLEEYLMVRLQFMLQQLRA